MAKLATKTFSWDDTNIAVQGVVSFNVYYNKGAAGSVNYNSTKINIPVVTGQTAYSVSIPAQLPLTEGQYELGVSAIDGAGNESDIAVLDPSPFDFTAPTAPTNLKIT